MGSLGHVSVDIVRNVGDAVDDTVIAGVAVGSLGDNHVTGVGAGGLLQRSSLLSFDSISGLVAKKTHDVGAW